MADQILLLEKGELLAIGKHEDLMKSSQVYRDVYKRQLYDCKKRDAQSKL